jgi:Raf kinase inhibitor-like YbhB/YbcL family protein
MLYGGIAMKVTYVVAVTVMVCVSLAWFPARCYSQGTPAKMEIQSLAFQEGGVIPNLYTCKGKNISPPLSWSGVPAGTAGIALIVEDPDAPMGTYDHWVVFNLPPDSNDLPEAVPAGKRLSNGALQGVTTGGKNGYLGPCPPSGTHRYFFKIYAVDKKIDLKSGATKKELLKAMQRHILAEGQLMGMFSK